jgi:ABC-type transporter Mla subunit MlaD
MRRTLGMIIMGGAISAVVALGLGAGGRAQGSPRFWIELDNAFGLVNGADVKVAGVRAGKITDEKVDLRTHRALVGIQIDGSRGNFNALRSDVSCESKPQSLIGEYFVDCQPCTSHTKLNPGSTIAVDHTTSTIPPDLVQNILRLPYRERLRLIVNELGTGVAGQEGNLNAALRRASPALRETDKVLAILAQQNLVLRDLTANADTVITALASNRRDVGRWVVEARNAASASAQRNVDLQATFHKLPGFLEELRPTMAALGRVADEQTPALQDLNASSGQLTRFFKDLGPFANASRPSLKSLGAASTVGDQAVRSAGTSVGLLKSFAAPTPELGRNLAIILRTLDDPRRAVEADPRAARVTGRPAPTGYSGLEALLQYIFDQEQSTNIFDQNSYMLKVSVFGGDCAPYRNAASLKDPNPVTGPPNNLTGPQLIAKCAAWLGPNQPGITTPDPTASSTPAQREAQRRQQHNTSVSGGPQPASTPTATGAPGGGGRPSKQNAPAIDVNKTLNQLLGTVPNLPKLPGGVQVPQQVQNQVPASRQDAEALLNYLLAP